MKILSIDSKYLEVVPREKAIESAEENPKPFSIKEALVVFTAVEDRDTAFVVDNTVEEIDKIAKQLKKNKIVIYPYVHLTNHPASPRLAKDILNKIVKKMENTYETIKAPFGWYKEFTITCKGHPLSELSREIGEEKKKEEEFIAESLKVEERLKSKFYIYTPNDELIEVDKYDFKNNENLKKLVEYEVKKNRVYEKEPVHIKLMKELEWVDYEPASDAGNLRFYPKGVLVKQLLEDMVRDYCLNLGAHEVETPIMYDFEHESLKSYLNRFPARQYVVLSDTKKYFLRFSACFGQFLIAHDSPISYKQLPIKMFELTHYSFRREQSGELSGLKRLRAFTMPDMHTLVRDLDEGIKEFKEQFQISKSYLETLGLFEQCETAFRVEKNFFDEHRDFYRSIVKMLNKPIMIEMFDNRYAYFITKFEFNFIDSMNKATALSTVQIDVENGKRFNIVYVDKNQEKKHPIILHASISGAIERVMYALLEREGMKKEKGQKAELIEWINPIQLRLIPLNEKALEKANEYAKQLEDYIRVDIDDTEETLGKKIMRANRMWIPFVGVIGDKELEEGKINVTIRKTGERKLMGVEEIKKIIKQPYWRKRNIPLHVSKQMIFKTRL